MIVGQDDAVSTDDHARTQALLHSLALLRRGAEELREEGIVGKGIGLNLRHRAGIDIHHRRHDPFDDGRKGQLHLPHRRWRDDRHHWQGTRRRRFQALTQRALRQGGNSINRYRKQGASAHGQ